MTSGLKETVHGAKPLVWMIFCVLVAVVFLFFFYSLEIFLQTAMYCQHTFKLLFMITKSPKYTETVVLQSYSNKELTICHMQCISNNFSPSITLFKDIPNPLFITDCNCPKFSLGSQKQSYIFLAYLAHSFCLSPLGE